MLLSTEAPTMPSVTLSNWEPLTRLGFQYEFFLGQLEQTSSNSGNSLPGDNIRLQRRASRGNPRLFGTQLSIEPFPGWSLGINRLVEYGGGSGLPDSASFLLHGFFNPSGNFQTQANQQASYVSRFIFPGKTPFAVYFQYAGEDNSDGGSYLLGNAALTAGIDFPEDLAPLRSHVRIFGVAEHLVRAQYLSGWHDQLRHRARQLGRGSAPFRRRRRRAQPDAARRLGAAVRRVPARSGCARVANQSYYGGDSRQYQPGQPAAYPYHHYYDFSMTYSRPWKGVTVGGEAFAGRDVYGQSFSRLSGFVRYGGDQHSHDGRDRRMTRTPTRKPPNEHGGEFFVDAGASVSSGAHQSACPRYR